MSVQQNNAIRQKLQKLRRKDGPTHLRQRGISAPDSWLNFRCTLSSCLVRISSWGMIAAELSLSKLSFRLLRERKHAHLVSKHCVLLLLWFRSIVSTLRNTRPKCYEDASEFSPLHRLSFPQTISPSMLLPLFYDLGSELVKTHTAFFPSTQEIEFLGRIGENLHFLPKPLKNSLGTLAGMPSLSLLLCLQDILGSDLQERVSYLSGLRHSYCYIQITSFHRSTERFWELFSTSIKCNSQRWILLIMSKTYTDCLLFWNGAALRQCSFAFLFFSFLQGQHVVKPWLKVMLLHD